MLSQNISLKPYNSFGVEASARYFGSFSSAAGLAAMLEEKPGLHKLILGGGSNILFTRNFDGVVCKNNIPGIEELHEDAEYIYVKAGAGENWNAFVQHCVQKGWAGLENLSLIPGLVGASPIQNIGAYGVELQDVFWDLEAFHLAEKAVHTFTRADLRFGYRDSVFKGKYRNQFAILNVTFRLHKIPIFHTGYGAIREELNKMGVTELNIGAIARAVIKIRSSKLPDPAVIGNAGSFFKNPTVSKEVYEQLLKDYPALVGYPNPDGSVKLAAGWLIEQCGFKGYRHGDAGCHEKQALVLVNHGKASGAEIRDLGEEIADVVKTKFGVALVPEVNIL